MAWTERYLNLAATNNGDGTASNDAASGGAVGAWNSFANAVTGLGTIATQTRVNVKGNVTLGGNVTLSTAGTSVTVPLWWRGYNTTPGDIESNNSLTKPLVTCSTNTVTVSTTYQVFTGLSFTGSTTAGGVVIATGGNIWFHRCRFACTGASSTSYALQATTTATLFVTACDLTSNALSNVLNSTVAAVVVGNNVRAGLTGLTTAGGGGIIAFNVIDGCSLHGISCVSPMVIGNSIYSAGGKSSADGIHITGTGSLVLNNLISNFNGTSNNGINCTSTTGLNARLVNNAYYNCTTNVAGVVESLEFLSPGTLGSDPFNDSVNHDFSIGAVAKALAFPGAFENAGFTGYLDLGAVQRAESQSIISGEF